MKNKNTPLRYIMQKLRIATVPVHDPPIFILMYRPGKTVCIEVIEIKNT